MVIVLSACKPDECHDRSDPDCENYDPFYGKSPFSTAFTISEQLGYGSPNNEIYTEDNLVVGRKLKFSVVDKNASSYTWYLGTDTFQYLTEKVLPIGIDLEYGTYYAALVLEKEPNLICFPNDAGSDSVYKKFTYIHWCDALFVGTYLGAWANVPNDSAEVSIQFSDVYF